jgi:hypothetical protein
MLTGDRQRVTTFEWMRPLADGCTSIIIPSSSRLSIQLWWKFMFDATR